MSQPRERDSGRRSERATGTELTAEFDRPVDVADAVVVTLERAIEEWPELSATPTIDRFVDVDRLNGLFGTRSTDGDGRPPSVTVGFQGCRVTVLYGRTVRVVVERRP